MLSIKETKRLLKDIKLSDKEAEEIRDQFRVLAEIVLEQWRKERSKK